MKTNIRINRLIASAVMMAFAWPLAPSSAAPLADSVGSFKIAADLSRRSSQELAVKQAANIIAVVSATLDPDGDGFPEAPAFVTGAGPAGGGLVPSNLGAPVSDGYGGRLGYCVWDNGSVVTTGVNRLAGSTTNLAAPAFAVVSAGLDGIFNRSCAQIAAGTVTTDDDFVVAMSTMQIKQGVGGTVYFGDPVATLAALNALNTVTTRDGELRLVKADNTMWRWNSTSGTWVTAASAVPLSSLTAASTTNLLDNAANAQRWNWQLSGNTTGFAIAETAASSGGSGSQYLHTIGTLSGSSAIALSVAVRGVEAFRVDSVNPQIVANGGSPTAPSYSFAGAQGTGLYLPTTSSLGAVIAGVTALKIDPVLYQTAVGYGALASATGINNLAFGHAALGAATTGTSNIGIGNFALQQLTTGVANTAIGNLALQLNTGNANTAVGNGVLAVNTSGINNTGLGSQALGLNSTGNSNMAIGVAAAYNNTSGNQNVAIGDSAFYGNTTGTGNTVIGTNALKRNTSGFYNVAIGANYLSVPVNPMTGYSNTFIGTNATSTDTAAMAASGRITLIGADAAATGLAAGNANAYMTAVGSGAVVSSINTVVLGRPGDRVVIGASADDASGAGLQVAGSSNLVGNVSIAGIATIASDAVIGGNAAVGGHVGVSIGRGVLYDTVGDRNWGTYLALPGAGRSIEGGTAVTGLDGRTSYGLRMRAFNGPNANFIWENSSEQALMTLSADTGNLYTKGTVNVGGNLVVTGSTTTNGRITATDFSATGALATTAQGAYLQWNRGVTDGSTYLVNQKGTGAGGFRFGETTAGNVFTQNLYLDASGNLNVAGSYSVNQGQNVRFGHVNQTDANDGKIGAGLFAAGLNIVGVQTVASAGRQIQIYGKMKTDSSIEASITGSGTGLALVTTAGGPAGYVDLTASTYSGGYTNAPPATIRFIDDNTYSDHITFRTKTTGGPANGDAERMRITSAGNVGIGTTSPTNKLDVAGTIGASKVAITQTAGVAGLVITGGDLSGNPVDNANGITIALGYNNTAGNRQIWMGGTESIGNGSASFFRMIAGTYMARLDAINGTGSTRLNLGLATDTTDLMVGGNVLSAYNAALPGKLSVFAEAAKKALVVRGAASQTGSLMELQNSSGTALFTVDAAGATTLANSLSGTTATFSGAVTAASFSGSGAALSALNANNITTGTLAVARGGTGLGTTPTNGQILIGNGSGYTLASITGGTGLTVTPGAGTISLSNTGVTSFNTRTGAVTLTNPDVHSVLFLAGANIAIGRANPFPARTTGNTNIFLGDTNASSNLTSGTSNIGFGYSTLATITTGGANIALGDYALVNVTTASDNTAIGLQALDGTTGAGNTALGIRSGRANTTGTYNLFLGNSANAGSSGLTYATALGSGSVVGTSNTVVLGRTTDTTVIGAASTDGSGNKLQVTGGGIVTTQPASGAGLTIYTTAGAVNAYVDIAAGTYGTIATNGAPASIRFVDDGNFSNNIAFRTKNGGAASNADAERMRLTSTGNLLIGSAVDDGSGNKLQVTGGIKATGNLTIGGTGTFTGAVTGASFAGNGAALTNLNASNITTGTLAVANGGTGLGTTPTNGQILIGNGSGYTLASITGGTGITVTPGAGSITLSSTGVTSFNTRTGAVVLTKADVDGVTTFGSGNVTLGSGSLPSTSNSSFNTAIGNFALPAAVFTTGATGAYNAAVGYSALRANTSGYSNSALGYSALMANVSGQLNTASGASALQASATGNGNSAFGASTLVSANGAGLNSAFGLSALYYTTSGSQNTAIGVQSLLSNTTGANNVALGINAGFAASDNVATNANTTGSGNTFIGAFARPGTATQLTYATALGSDSLVTTSNTIVLGRALTDNTVIGATGDDGSGNKLQVTGGIKGTGNLTIGGTGTFTGAVTAASFSGSGASLTALNANNISTGTLAVARGGTGLGTTPTNGQLLIGNGSGYTLASITGGTGITVTPGAGTIALSNTGVTSFNTRTGAVVLIKADVDGAVAFGTANTSIGNNSLPATSTSSGNTAFGDSALPAISAGSNNSAFGRSTLTLNTDGSNNTAVGISALSQNTLANFNTAVGDSALRNTTTGGTNSAFGGSALQNNTTGLSNVALGMFAGYATSGGSSVNANFTGSNNTFLGAYAMPGTTTQLTYAMALGSAALVTTPNTIVLGRATNDFTVIGATGDDGSGNKLQVTGGIKATGNLTVGGTGTITGAVTAASFAGNGAALTALNASNITTGTLAVANGGTGLGTTPTNGQILIGNGTGYTLASITGGTGITVTPGAGTIALSNTGVTSFNTRTGAVTLNKADVDGAVAFGASSNSTSIGNGSLPTTSAGLTNTAYGKNSLAAATTSGNFNTGVGFESLKALTAGANNNAFGHAALTSLVNGFNNTAVGFASIITNVSGSQNTAVGNYSLNTGTGSFNTALGYQALYSTSTGASNVALGRSAGAATSADVFTNANTTGSNNTFLGAYAMPGTSTQLTYATALGSDALVTTSNTLALGRATDVAVIGATGDDGSGNRLQVTGSMKATVTTSRAALTLINTQGGLGNYVDLAASTYGQNYTNSSPSTIRFIDNGNYSNDISFRTKNIGSSANADAERMRLTSDGKLLIGSATDDGSGNLLQITGGMKATGNLTVGGTGTFTGAVTAASFSGNGASLTALNASNISTGTLAVARGGTGLGTTPTNGQILIGNGSGYTLASITGGTGITVTPGAGTIALANTGVTSFNSRTGAVTLVRADVDNAASISFQNTVIGQNAYPASSTGSYNTVIGYSAMASNTSGYGNSAVGTNALRANTTGFNNIAFGDRALDGNIGGSANTAFGQWSLGLTTSGTGNTGAGYYAGNSNTTGTNNTFFGYQADTSVNNLTYATALGSNAIVSTSSTVVLGRIGDSTVIGATGTDGSGNKLQVSGGIKATGNVTAATVITGVGSPGAPSHTFTGSTTTGLYAPATDTLGFSLASVRAMWLTSANTAFGINAMSKSPTGSQNVAVGDNAMFNSTGSCCSTVVGSNASYNVTSGQYAVAVGYAANIGHTTGWGNTAVGSFAMYNGTNSTGQFNTAIGYMAGNVTSVPLTGQSNTLLGANSSFEATAAMGGSSYITLLGASATATGLGSANAAAYMTAVGAGSNVTSINTVVLGRTGDSVVIGQTSNNPSYKFYVAGSAGGSSGWNVASDARYKKNVAPIMGAMDLIGKLQGVRYDLNREAFPDRNFEAGRQIGFIAQQIEPFVPEIVRTDAQGYKSVQYSQIVPLLVEGMKVQQSILKHLVKKDPTTLTVDIKTFQANDAIFESIKSAHVRTAQLEAETARIKKLEADRIDAKFVRSDVVKTGEAEVFVTAGTFQPIFAPQADSQYIVNVTAEDGSSAFASVAFMSGKISITPISGKGVDVTAIGTQVGLVAASKKVKATWIRMS